MAGLRRDPWLGYTGRRLRRHLHWLRSQGLARLVAEDELNPVDRATKAASKWRWRLTHRARPPGGTAVFLVGVQRSGTNMLVHGLERSPEFAVYNENHRAAFSRFQLRPDPVIRRLVEQSRHPYVLFKPLCDSHRTPELLDGLGLERSPRALWAYRSVDGRARSAVAKFGDVNLRVLRELANGGGRTRWQAQRLSSDSLQLIASFDWDRMGPLDAAALFWYVRNRLYFELGLAGRPDVLVVSYDAMVAQPEAEMARICQFLGVAYDRRLIAHVTPRPAGHADVLQLDHRIRDRCEELSARLEAARGRAPAPLPGEVGR
jgi:hypothetical protein